MISDFLVAPRVGFVRTSESEDGIAYRYGIAVDRVTYDLVVEKTTEVK